LRSGRGRLDGRDYAIYSYKAARGCQTSTAMTLAKKMMARKSITRPARANKSAARKKQLPASEKTLLAPETVSSKKDDIIQTRTIAHDLSNSLEAILQASYLLSQAKLDPNSKRWVQLIDSASQEAARLNRELRKHLRNICED
jgi:hypothetical protein